MIYIYIYINIIYIYIYIYIARIARIAQNDELHLVLLRKVFFGAH